MVRGKNKNIEHKYLEECKRRGRLDENLPDNGILDLQDSPEPSDSSDNDADSDMEPEPEPQGRN